MGAAKLTSIMLAGDAVQGNFGQSRTITFGLASTSISNYQAPSTSRPPRCTPPATACPERRGDAAVRRPRPARTS